MLGFDRPKGVGNSSYPTESLTLEYLILKYVNNNEQEQVMVMQPTYGNGFIDSSTIELSQEGLRSILNQIEAELIDSEVYRRTMAGLQTMLGEASSNAHILVKAVGREAVRLTFQEFARQYKVVPVTPVASDGMNQPTETEEEELEIPQTEETECPIGSKETMPHRVETNLSPSLADREIGENQSRKKLSKAELAAQKLFLEREEMLQHIGQQLRRARKSRSLSLQQLHRQTLVPIHQIEALETGSLAQLPEDIYVRGFIRRLGYALGLDGVALALSLPEIDPVKSVVPSWYKDPVATGFHLKSVHLYLGYATLIAGAVGGLNWMSNQQSAPQNTAEPEPVPSGQNSISPKAETSEYTHKPGIKSGQTGVQAGADIAPPEAFPF